MLVALHHLNGKDRHQRPSDDAARFKFIRDPTRKQLVTGGGGPPRGPSVRNVLLPAPFRAVTAM
jgi:hypothetical protein